MVIEVDEDRNSEGCRQKPRRGSRMRHQASVTCRSLCRRCPLLCLRESLRLNESVCPALPMKPILCGHTFRRILKLCRLFQKRFTNCTNPIDVVWYYNNNNSSDFRGGGDDDRCFRLIEPLSLLSMHTFAFIAVHVWCS